MKKSKFVKSTLILIIGGMITKILGMVIRIIQTRLLGMEGIGIYSLLNPTFMLLIVISQLGFPIAISKLVAENKRNNKNLIFSIIPISLILNVIMIILIFLLAPIISNKFLHEPRTYYAILCMGLVLPFISISSILRGYFFGKERMFPHVISNIFEDIVRIIIIIIFVPLFMTQGIEYAVAFLIISNIISEVSSILILLIFLPKNFKITKQDLRPRKSNIKNVLDISIPVTSSRLIGNIGYFFEPILLTTILLKVGYNLDFIVTEYGILNGFVMPILLLPSFFTMAISQALVPVISKSYSNGDIKFCKRKIKQAILFSLLIGIPITILLMLFPTIPLNFLYNTNHGVSYLIFLAPIFLLQYIQSPLSSSLQALGKAKISMNATLIGTIIRLSSLSILSLFKIGCWGLIIGLSLSVLTTTIYSLKKIRKFLS